MRYFINFLLIVGLLVVTISGQPCKPEGFTCVATRECCPNLECSIHDRQCLGRFTCRRLGQYCTSDVNCCAGLRCHPQRSRCVTADSLCRQWGQACDIFNKCCSGLRCNMRGQCQF